MFVFSHLSQLDASFGEAFGTSIKSAFASVNVEVDVAVISDLELDEDRYLKQMEVFSPNVIMVLRPTEIIRKSGGGVHSAVVNAILYEGKSLDKRFWRARIEIENGDSPGKGLADKITAEIIKKLKEDALI